MISAEETIRRVGRIIAATPLFKDVVMTRTVPILQEMTVYSRFGDVFAAACLVISLIAAASACLYHLFRKYSG